MGEEVFKLLPNVLLDLNINSYDKDSVTLRLTIGGDERI